MLALRAFDRGASFNFSKQITSHFDASYKKNHGVEDFSALSSKFNIIKNVKKRACAQIRGSIALCASDTILKNHNS